MYVINFGVKIKFLIKVKNFLEKTIDYVCDKFWTKEENLRKVKMSEKKHWNNVCIFIFFL